ncbi:hypothetical protein E2C01_084345 [Portunus trituberculatus]|uniref:Uncharacterized protein n=1 Tax=Portunus trituberculatus TaxID=210409 RepID=A0A5B7IY08_PORTR|nr:hypothetical protein [Portunus trituberculatus]
MVTEPRHVVHPHIISHWICQVIQHAHVDVSEEDMCLVQDTSVSPTSGYGLHLVSFGFVQLLVRVRAVQTLALPPCVSGPRFPATSPKT